MTIPTIAEIFGNPALVLNLNVRQWELIISQARAANLLSRLYILLDEQGLTSDLPEGPRHHLQSAHKQSARQHRQVRWEVSIVTKALADLPMDPVILKGGAYVCKNLPAAKGRTLNDIDILVPRNLLPEVEKRLLIEGFLTTTIDDYDTRYYREWTHEIPPLQHFKRGTTLDIHHNILPTLRRKLDPETLIDKAERDSSGVTALQLPDMIIHSAAHLFLEGEFDNGLRDLNDLHQLLSLLTTGHDWQKLEDRAVELSLQLPIFYAARHSARLFGTEIPTGFLNKTNNLPAGLRLWTMDSLLKSVLVPHHPSCTPRLFALHSFLLYMRGHWLKMPLKMLVPHLVRKAFVSQKAEQQRPEGALPPV